MAVNGNATNLQSSRPAIAVGGRDEPSLAGGLLELLVEETVTGLHRCEASFGNWGPVGQSNDFLYFDRRTLDFGKDLRVSVGGDTLFEGKITALEARFPEGSAPTIVALAEDRFQDLRMTRRTRTFADVTDSDVIGQVAQGHGLTPDVTVNGPRHKVVVQLNQSDLAFLRERARAVDAELAMTGSGISVKPRTSRGAGAPLELSHGRDLREFRVMADLAGQRTEMKVSGWDVSGKQALVERAGESALGAELRGGDGGASVLSRAFGQRGEAVANSIPLTSGEARARAEALFRHQARRFVVGQGVCQSSAKLRVGATVRFAKLGPLFDGDYYLCEVRHRFDGELGLRTEIRAERPGLGRP